MNTNQVATNADSAAALAAIKAAREAERGPVAMCETHPAFEADYCPSCGTARVI